MCWSCVADGDITQEAYDFTEAFLDKWPSSDYGPAHIVIADNNYEDGNIEFCLENIDNPQFNHRPFQPGEREATIEMLKELLSWPIERRLGQKGLAELSV